VDGCQRLRSLADKDDWKILSLGHGRRVGVRGAIRQSLPLSERDQKNFAGRSAISTGSFGPNARGLFDLHGSVAEWVEDCGASSLKDAPKNGKAIIAAGCKRVIKGGGWHSSAEDVRFAARTAVSGGTVSNGIGFRVARDFD
jgi:formylglycine-generating enzyme required for sulfatase activity